MNVSPQPGVELIADARGLGRVEAAWRKLAAGHPLRGPEWLATWWAHYGDAAGEPFLLLVTHAGAPIGLAPWRRERSARYGRAVRWLGDGEACTDHLTILAAPTDAPAVVDTIAHWLLEHHDAWDMLLLEHCDHDDPVTAGLMTKLAEAGRRTRETADGACWSIDLPGDWESFLALQSKSHRKQIRQAERRVLDTPRCQWRRVETEEDWRDGWPVLRALHQQRRQSLGEPGCFASARFSAFQAEASRRLLDRGQLRLAWLELDGRALAAEHHVAGPTGVFAYQGGVDPTRLADEPGRLSTIAALRDAIADGATTFDFLRGDEPYKAHWRAEPRPTVRRQAASRGAVAAVRYSFDRWASALRSAARAGLRTEGRA